MSTVDASGAAVTTIDERIENLQEQLSDLLQEQVSDLADAAYDEGHEAGYQDGLNDALRFVAGYVKSLNVGEYDQAYLDGLGDAIATLAQNGAEDESTDEDRDAATAAPAGSENGAEDVDSP